MDSAGEDRSSAPAALGAAVPMLLMVCAVGALVAIATSGVRLLVPAADLPGAWTWLVRLAGVGAIAAGAAGLSLQRSRIRAAGGPSPDPTVVAFRTAATIMCALAAVALLSAPPSPAPERPEGGPPSTLRQGAFGGGGLDAPRPRPAIGGPSVIRGSRFEGVIEGPQGPGAAEEEEGLAGRLLRRVVGTLPPLLLLAVVAMTFLSLTRRLRRRAEGPAVDPPIDPAEAEAGLVASLDEVARDGLDPRGQITAAYHRLLAALAAAGAPRRPEEAPHEHLYRTLGPLGVPPQPLHRLTALYVVAHFSRRPVAEEHRAAAAEALDTSLSSLRAAHRSLSAVAHVTAPEGRGA